eukprot:1001659-Pyramimonas_sp.AAC.1
MAGLSRFVPVRSHFCTCGPAPAVRHCVLRCRERVRGPAVIATTCPDDWLAACPAACMCRYASCPPRRRAAQCAGKGCRRRRWRQPCLP